MSRNKFEDILRNLHVRDNLTITAGQKDRLFKLRPMIDLLNFRFKQKGLPVLAPDRALNRGSFDQKHSGSIGVYKWRDSKNVLFASNYHGTEVASVITAPQVAKDYHDHMGGVNLSDQKRVAYGRDRKYSYIVSLVCVFNATPVDGLLSIHTGFSGILSLS
ncbi:hypothetical protein QYM36_014202 [Artemia franciscana]|uniref:PiggyBac transposable element-derived protein domain-containing protein n=1 Tax=Artemia franciscana TaxID=6661 RepID=A0AA88HJ61_ARTSF|nr:hypothetical protein QYM36_014202 [Artemia franciscana]